MLSSDTNGICKDITGLGRWGNGDVRTINEHIKRIYSDSKLEEDATIRNFQIVQTEGSRQVTRNTKHYNLQMIIAIGLEVNNERADADKLHMGLTT